MPNRFITRGSERLRWKCALLCLELLQASDVRLGFGEPCQEILQPFVDVVDVKRRDFHYLGHFTGIATLRGDDNPWHNTQIYRLTLTLRWAPLDLPKPRSICRSQLPFRPFGENRLGRSPCFLPCRISSELGRANPKSSDLKIPWPGFCVDCRSPIISSERRSF
jgi:hypothetical protein